MPCVKIEQIINCTNKYFQSGVNIRAYKEAGIFHNAVDNDRSMLKLAFPFELQFCYITVCNCLLLIIILFAFSIQLSKLIEIDKFLHKQ